MECKERIEGALQIKGIDSASWDVNTKMLKVVFDTSKIQVEKIQSKILAVGHDLEDKKADDKIYQSLPACCQYREKNDHSHATTEAVSANSVSGVVLSEDSKGNLSPLEGASIYWSGSHDGTVSDKSGFFTIQRGADKAKLVVSYVGFQTDSTEITGEGHLQIVLASSGQLKGITIKGKPKFSYINLMGPMRNMTLNSADLLKAACCNLSESFETNPSVDVSYSDAVTGSKQ
ncbi:MAG TPA: carboxypeptidase-like regulatory domain-containing protein, partial [Hanamia sp.]|nr:carboxypeptidase-like regulatory domain-containing protein [Hanamia sp.]